MAIIRILYDEGIEDSYEAVEISLQEYENNYGIPVDLYCSTNDVVQDFKNAMKLTEGLYWVSLSSSCDHFVSDNDGYYWEMNEDYGEIITT